MMRPISAASLLSLFMACCAHAVLTTTVVPIGGVTTATGNDTVSYEVFVSSDVFQRIKGGQAGMFCIINNGMGTLNVIPMGITVNPLGGMGGTVPALCSPGLTPVSEANCFATQTPSPLAPPCELPAGQMRYMATITYRVAPFASGSFMINVEGVTNPPAATNETRFRDDVRGQGTLIPIVQTIGAMLTVPVGQCCVGGLCQGDLNQFHCENEFLGEWTAGQSCADGCPCNSNEDCADSNPCTADSCVMNRCVNEPVDKDLCDDGLFCTALSFCQGGECIGGGIVCEEDQFCNESLNACVECLTVADCNDGNPCTDDGCSVLGVCEHRDNNLSCNDGLFCTRMDLCGGGICVGGGPPRCTNQALPICNEDTNQCVACIDPSDCNDENPCTTDICAVTECRYELSSDSCDDGFFCTSNDRCFDGECIGGQGDPCPPLHVCDEETDTCISGCPVANIFVSDPPSGTVDARQPHPLDDNSLAARQGIGGPSEPIVLTIGLHNVPPLCFTLCETASDPVLGSNVINNVTEDSIGVYRIRLRRPITPGAVTTIEYGNGQFIELTSHPANSNGDGAADADDILDWMDYLSGMEPPPFGRHSLDINHSGQLDVGDLTRALDLLNGAGDLYPPWNGTMLPTNTACP
ncbi:MAG: hypothetical protein AABZ47_14515 [Planctomycetota bacterium]